MADKRRKPKKNFGSLPTGTVLTDIAKVQWKIQEPIGQGGFGVIYSAEKLDSAVKNREAAFAAKIEPHGNGPLFVEKNFFLRYLKPEMLEEYKRKKKLSFLGLPKFIGGGSHDQNSVSYRFLIMERFGDNINKKLKSTPNLDVQLLGQYCSQIIDSLMYIHDKGYAHMDVKPENLLLKYNSDDQNVYLIDFGVIEKYTTDTELKPDKKKQHNGTLLYSSRDSHLGVGTRRGDLEVLAFNILKWFNIQLPWENDIKTPVVVHEKKVNFMNDVKKNIANKVPENIIKYILYVDSLKHNDTPDYEYAKSLLTNTAKVSTPRSTNKRKLNNRLGDGEENVSNGKLKESRQKGGSSRVPAKKSNPVSKPKKVVAMRITRSKIK